MNLPILADSLSAFASAFTQNQRILKLRFSPNAGIPEDTLLPWKLTGSEAINEGYRFELTCLSASAHLELKGLIGQPVEVSILTDSGDYRPLSGWVRRIIQDDADGGMGRYVLVIEDLFSLLQLRVNNRVFQSITAKDAFLSIVREHQRDNSVLAASLLIDDRTSRDYPVQSWITQYNESDAAFGRRKLAEEGVNFFFTHDGGDANHPVTTLVLFDDNAQLKDSGDIRFHRADGTEQSDSITAWRAERNLAPSQISSASFDYKPVVTGQAQERSRLDQGATGNNLASTLEDYRHDSNHYGNDPDDLQRYAVLRMQSYEYAAKGFSGEGSFRGIPVGNSFTLSQHHEIDAHDALEREFVLTKLDIQAQNNLPGELQSPAEQVNGNTQPVFQNQFNASRNTVRIVPEYRQTEHAKPSAPHLLSASVVGPDGEEIYTDAMGRICVNLHFPRPQDHIQGGASRNETDSVWIRVMQSWSGGEYGALFIPRIGDEVLVAFIGGDIDRPIVMGNAYNGAHRPATFSHTSTLPGNKTLSGIKSKMYKGAGANELLLDDSTNQLRARLASDHGMTELNQGYLVHPRHDAQATPRGEGFELRSDLSGALRAALGILISTDARNKASGTQLDRQEFQGQLELTLNILKQLSELSTTHQAEDTDSKAQEQLLDHVKHWEAGSNTDKDGDKSQGGKPIVAISGQAGIAISTPQNTTVSAGTNLDMVSVQDTSISTGRSVKVRAANLISLFAHKLGMKLIAASGKIEIQAHNDNIEITSAKKLTLTALEEIILNTPKLTINTQGAGMSMGGGQITSKTTGAHTAHAGQHSVTGPAAPNFTLPNMPQSAMKTDEKFVMRLTNGEPMKQLKYRIRKTDGQIVEGQTDELGHTAITQSEMIAGARLLWIEG